MGSIHEAKRRIDEFLEQQIIGVNKVIQSGDMRISPEAAKNYVHYVRLAIRDMYVFDYLSATFLLKKIIAHMLTVTDFEQPADRITGIFIFHDCIVTINPVNPIDYFLAKVRCLIDDVATLKDFRDHVAKL